MVPEIGSETDRIFWPFFLLFYTPRPPNDPEYQNFEKKKKKMPADIALLYVYVCMFVCVCVYVYLCVCVCTINEDHMIYGS